MVTEPEIPGVWLGFSELIQARRVVSMPETIVLPAVVLLTNFNPVGRSWAWQWMTLTQFQPPPLPSCVT